MNFCLLVMRAPLGSNARLDGLLLKDGNGKSGIAMEVGRHRLSGERAAAEAMRAGPIIGGMTEQGTARPETRTTGNKRHFWNWLLAVPLLLLAYPGMYARSTPELFGFPFFYWYQFAVVIATALLTGAVYWLTRGGANAGDEGGG
jgi:hypothetical protein